MEETAEGRNLTWQTPALGEPIYLRWHDGSCYDAGGQQNGGAFFAGANWFAEDLKNYSNLQLSDVEVYINQVPDALYLLVYQNNTLVRQQFVPTLKQYSFNTIHLEEPLQIDPSKSMRVAVYVEHNEYTDNSDVKANYLEYQVAAVYSKTGEKFSNKVTLMTTGINGVESQQMKVEIAGNTLRIIGAHTGDKIAVYALDGKTILEDKVGDTYIQDVSLSALNTGTYIVKVGKSNFKVCVSHK